MTRFLSITPRSHCCHFRGLPEDTLRSGDTGVAETSSRPGLASDERTPDTEGFWCPVTDAERPVWALLVTYFPGPLLGFHSEGVIPTVLEICEQVRRVIIHIDQKGDFNYKNTHSVFSFH